MTREQFRDDLVRLQDFLGLTNEDLAELLQVSPTTVQRWRNSVACIAPAGRQPTIAALRKLAGFST